MAMNSSFIQSKRTLQLLLPVDNLFLHFDLCKTDILVSGIAMHHNHILYLSTAFE